MYNINFVQFVALFSLGRIWEIYTKYIFLMFYWPEERNELALGTIRYSHHTFPSTAGIGVIECEDIKDHSWNSLWTCPPPGRRVFVGDWVDDSITLATATVKKSHNLGDKKPSCWSIGWGWRQIFNGGPVQILESHQVLMTSEGTKSENIKRCYNEVF